MHQTLWVMTVPSFFHHFDVSWSITQNRMGTRLEARYFVSFLFFFLYWFILSFCRSPRHILKPAAVLSTMPVIRSPRSVLLSFDWVSPCIDSCLVLTRCLWTQKLLLPLPQKLIRCCQTLPEMKFQMWISMSYIFSFEVSIMTWVCY